MLLFTKVKFSFLLWCIWEVQSLLKAPFCHQYCILSFIFVRQAAFEAVWKDEIVYSVQWFCWCMFYHTYSCGYDDRNVLHELWHLPFHFCSRLQTEQNCYQIYLCFSSWIFFNSRDIKMWKNLKLFTSFIHLM